MRKKVSNFNNTDYKKDNVSGLISPQNQTQRYMNNHVSKDDAIGYCHHDTHKGYLDKKTITKHKCLDKKCKFFSKYNDHPYWKQRDSHKLQAKLSQKISKHMLYNNENALFINNRWLVIKNNKENIYNLIKEEEITSLDQIKYGRFTMKNDSYGKTISFEASE